MITVTSYLGIGSNLGDREANIKQSIRHLKSNRRISIKRISSFYESPACGGPKNQPKYLNAAAKIQTSLTPLELLKELKKIELKLKRKKAVQWGPRTIDLDILFYGDLLFFNRDFAVPHHLLHKRAFVLRPLSDIAPKLRHPIYKKNVKELLKRTRGKKNIVLFSKG